MGWVWNLQSHVSLSQVPRSLTSQYFWFLKIFSLKVIGIKLFRGRDLRRFRFNFRGSKTVCSVSPYRLFRWKLIRTCNYADSAQIFTHFASNGSKEFAQLSILYSFFHTAFFPSYLDGKGQINSYLSLWQYSHQPFLVLLTFALSDGVIRRGMEVGQEVRMMWVGCVYATLKRIINSLCQSWHTVIRNWSGHFSVGIAIRPNTRLKGFWGDHTANQPICLPFLPSNITLCQTSLW